MATNPQRRLALTLSAIGALAIIAIVAAILLNLSNRPSPSASTGSPSVQDTSTTAMPTTSRPSPGSSPDTAESPSQLPTSSSAPTSTPAARTQAQCIAALPLETRLAQKIMAAGYAATLTQQAPAFADRALGGVILMDEAGAPAVTAFKNAQKIAPFVATDQEGGTVQRYVSDGRMLGAAQMTQLSPDAAYQAYLQDFRFLASQGITTNFAPVVDVSYPGFDPLPGRMYSANPEVVTTYATQAVKASEDAGITPVIKHFPGLGSASGNTDFAPASTADLATLKTKDFLPYQQMRGLVPDVMVNNASVPGLTNGQPASLSRAAITDTLRGQLGYKDAVVYTDSLTAAAIPGLLSDASIKAWQAGADVALFVQPAGDNSILAAYADPIIEAGKKAVAAGTLNEDEVNASVARILDRKGVNACTLPT